MLLRFTHDIVYQCLHLIASCVPISLLVLILAGVTLARSRERGGGASSKEGSPIRPHSTPENTNSQLPPYQMTIVTM